MFVLSSGFTTIRDDACPFHASALRPVSRAGPMRIPRVDQFLTLTEDKTKRLASVKKNYTAEDRKSCRKVCVAGLDQAPEKKVYKP